MINEHFINITNVGAKICYRICQVPIYVHKIGLFLNICYVYKKVNTVIVNNM